MCFVLRCGRWLYPRKFGLEYCSFFFFFFLVYLLANYGSLEMSALFRIGFSRSRRKTRETGAQHRCILRRSTIVRSQRNIALKRGHSRFGGRGVKRVLIDLAGLYMRLFLCFIFHFHS